MRQQLLRKNFFGFLIAIIFYLGAAEKAQAQWVLIPDTNFRKAIAVLVPSAISGNNMDTTNTQIINMTSLDVSSKSIKDLTGVQYFKSLKTLNCSNNSLSFLPPLSSTITHLDCSYNSLVTLHDLPVSINYLDCTTNSLTSLPALPLHLPLYIVD